MQKGFTLFELSIVLLISSLLLVIGIPAIKNFWERNIVVAELHSLEDAFNKARRRAVIDGYPIVVCSLSAVNRCQRTWQNKIDIFKDTNQNRTLDSEDLYLRTHTVNSRLELIAKLSARRSYLQYDPDGTTHGTAGSIQLCNAEFNAINQRALIISMTGRLRRSFDRNKDGLHEAGSKNICL